MTAIDLEQELDKIISRGAIKALFQPIFNIQTQKLHGVEALSRGPSHSPLYSPVPLFQTAEHHGRLSELETLCRRISLCEFTQRQLPGKLFINISPKALLDPDHPKGVTLALLQKLGIPPSQVVIELSEQHPADDIDLLKSCLNHYRSQGFLTAIDDLGTGYSGLRLWSELAPDYVKIDRHFIHDIDTNPVKQEFVRSIVDLCQSLTCKVIAEGIETQAELAVLKQLGIVYCQGFLLGRPEERPTAQLPPDLNLPRQRPQTRYKESIESLCGNALTASPATTLKQLSEQFIGQPALQAIVIIEGEQALGLVSRSVLLELFSTPFGRALHEHHPAHSVMDTRVLQFDAREPLSRVSQQLTRDSEHTVAQHFLVTRQGRFIGIGHTKDLLQRITEHRIKMARHANPLTDLPGNVPIQEELKRLAQLHKPFYLAYFDLCNFKPYNDVYGFSRGDEVNREVAGLLNRHRGADCFIGHIGGDDFVMIGNCDSLLENCRQILNEFNDNRAIFYKDEHWLAQQLPARDRQGNPGFQSLMSLCVGILPPQMTQDCQEHRLSALSAGAKKQAKLSQDGFYLCQANLADVKSLPRVQDGVVPFQTRELQA